MKLGRNDPCPCGSGKKYKQCCLAKDEAKERDVRAKAEAKAAKQPAAAEEPAEESAAQAAKKPPRHGTQQPWKDKGQANTRGFQRVNSMRKVGGS
jgi:hypothetical protein